MQKIAEIKIQKVFLLLCDSRTLTISLYAENCLICYFAKMSLSKIKRILTEKWVLLASKTPAVSVSGVFDVDVRRPVHLAGF